MRAPVVLVALLLVLVGVGAAPGGATTRQEVEEALTCQCGCGLTVHSCNHLQCPSGEPIKSEIGERLRKGEDKDTILAAFRARYGEKVLSAPTFHGFNWFAWVTPFVAFGVGLVGVTFAVRRWRPGRQAEPAEVPAGAEASPALRDRLARELADLDRER